MKYFANILRFTKLTVVLIQVRKANFDVNENVFSLEFGR